MMSDQGRRAPAAISAKRSDLMRLGVLVCILALVGSTLVIGPAAGQQQPLAAKKEKATTPPEFPPFADIAKGYEKVVSRADNAKSLHFYK